jgi:hypothetical protein
MDLQNIYALGDYNTEQIKEFAETVKAEGLDERSIFARRPDAAADIPALIASLTPDEVPYIIPDAFAGKAGLSIVEALSLPQLEAIGGEGDGSLKEAVRIKLEELAAQKPSDENIKQKQRYIVYSPAWQA